MNQDRNLLVRDAREDERPAIQAITLASYEEYAATMGQPLWEGYRRQLLQTLDERGPVERIVAESEGSLVGSVMLYPGASQVYARAERLQWPEVRLLAVRPATRGQGVGNALMDECERRARQAGATFLGLHTLDLMQAAVRLYERRGFARAPASDFSPGAGIVIKGYLLNLAP